MPISASAEPTSRCRPDGWPCKPRTAGLGVRRRIVAIPAGPPPAFNPGCPEQNVIAYTLWGDQPRYHVPLLENARIRPHLFPEWTIRVYHDPTVDAGYLAQLAAHGAQLRSMGLPPGLPVHRALLWRFEVIADPGVARFLIRDADSLLTVKERVAVDAWLRSDFHFHAMRDWYSHTDLLLAGMWGGVGGILPPPAKLQRAASSWRMENDHVDQDLAECNGLAGNPPRRADSRQYFSAVPGQRAVSSVRCPAGGASYRAECIRPFQQVRLDCRRLRPS